MPNEVITRRCSKCQEEKTVNQFYKRTARSSGLTSWCKACFSAHREKTNWAAQKRYNKTENQRANKRRYWKSEKGKAAGMRYCYKARSNPAQRPKTAAIDAVQYALRIGKITRPKECQRCGKQGRIEGHHHLGYDQSHRLDVLWLCPQCHHACT